MMIRISTFLSIFFIILSGIIPTTSFAELISPWKGNVEFSYLETSGNTESKTLVLAAKAERAFSSSKLTAEFTSIFGEKGDVTTDRAWLAKLKYDKNITARTYAYLMEVVDRNKLKGVDIRYNSLAGIGYYFINSPNNILKGELGIGYTRENPTPPSEDRGFANARAFGEYDHIFTPTTRFIQTAEIIPSLKEHKDYLMTSDTSFITNLMGNLALKTSFIVIYDNMPPDSFKKSDRLFKTALLYTF